MSMPLERDTVFWLASMTKPITAVSVMRMEASKIDDLVSKFIPECQFGGAKQFSFRDQVSGPLLGYLLREILAPGDRQASCASMARMRVQVNTEASCEGERVHTQ
jgi:hypothetical protein